MKKSTKVIGYILTVLFILIGCTIFFYSDFVQPLKYKYPLGLGACLISLVLAWLLSNKEKKKSSKKVFIYVLVLTVAWIVLSFVM